MEEILRKLNKQGLLVTDAIEIACIDEPLDLGVIEIMLKNRWITRLQDELYVDSVESPILFDEYKKWAGWKETEGIYGGFAVLTAAQIAKMEGKQELYELLLRYGARADADSEFNYPVL